MIRKTGNNFGSLYPNLASAGIEVCAWDQRGWGQSVKSPKEKGLTGPTERVMNDITNFIDAQLPSNVPLFLMGHSMGGGQVLNYAALGPLKTRAQIRGYLIEAPLIKIAPSAAPWKITEIAGRLAAKVVPHMHMTNELKAELLCRDPEVCKAIRADPLCHNTGTLRGLEGMMDRSRHLDEGIVVPKEDALEPGKQGILFASGSGDGVIDHDAVMRFANKLDWKDKTIKEYPGWYHVLHQEPGEDKQTFARDVSEWILARC